MWFLSENCFNVNLHQFFKHILKCTVHSQYVHFLWIASDWHYSSTSTSIQVWIIIQHSVCSLNSNAKPGEWHTILFGIYPYCQLPEIKCMMFMQPVPTTGSGWILWEDSIREDFVRNDCHFHLIWLSVLLENSGLFDSDSSWFRPSALWPWNTPLCKLKIKRESANRGRAMQATMYHQLNEGFVYLKQHIYLRVVVVR